MTNAAMLKLSMTSGAGLITITGMRKVIMQNKRFTSYKGKF